MNLKLKHHFAAAHQLTHAYSKECNDYMHGHNFGVEVEVETNKLLNNMIVDFKFIKEVINKLDHKNLNDILDFEPTAENLATYLQKEIKDNILKNDTESRYLNVSVEVEEAVGASVTCKDRDESLLSWFVGFVDGEGYFTLKKYTNSYVNRFGIELRADDSQVIYEIQRQLGCGRVSFRKNKTSFTKNELVVFEIDKRDDLVNKLIPIFDKYPLRAKKRRDFAIWKEGVLLLSNRERFKIDGDIHKRLGVLIQKLTDIRKISS